MKFEAMMPAPAADGAEYRFFDAFEAREAAFNAAVGGLMPIRHKGPQTFWSDFRRLSTGTPPPGKLPAAVTSNPRDGLAFGSPYQELSAAKLVARSKRAEIEAEIEALAKRFGLTALLFQPMRTLSGGETVRLALAKARAVAPFRPRLVIASPFTWLSENHRGLLNETVTAFRTEGKPVHILALAGEDDRSPMNACWIAAAPICGLPFRLRTQGLRIALGLPINALTAEPAAALVRDTALELASPCLIAGQNGQGKSLLAKALSGAAAIEGRFELHGAGAISGRARLLFQDVINQALLRRMVDLPPAGRAGYEVQTCYRQLLNDCTRILGQCGRAAAARSEPAGSDLLALKAMLVAVRLATRPAALILDEPDWGLAREAALALVLAIVGAAHAVQVPVLIISHKPRWQPLAQSRLDVAKHASASARFEIHLEGAGS